jgi:hypothetical protein
MRIEVAIAGFALLLMLTTACLVECVKALVRQLRDGRTYDSQLGKVDEYDNQSMYGMHANGLACLIIVCVVIQIILLVSTYRFFAAQ